MIQEIRAIFDRIKFYDACPDCKGRCCYLPWISKEECELVSLFGDAVEKVDNTNFFLNRKQCKFLDNKGLCTIYDIRPLDCKLFPLDIIEQEGSYYWCIFTTCLGWKEMTELLKPIIPEIESKITKELWLQFKDQIAITKEIYAPYKNKQYVILQEFTKFS